MISEVLIVLQLQNTTVWEGETSFIAISLSFISLTMTGILIV